MTGHGDNTARQFEPGRDQPPEQIKLNLNLNTTSFVANLGMAISVKASDRRAVKLVLGNPGSKPVGPVRVVCGVHPLMRVRLGTTIESMLASHLTPRAAIERAVAWDAGAPLPVSLIGEDSWETMEVFKTEMGEIPPGRPKQMTLPDKFLRSAVGLSLTTFQPLDLHFVVLHERVGNRSGHTLARFRLEPALLPGGYSVGSDLRFKVGLPGHRLDMPAKLRVADELSERELVAFAEDAAQDQSLAPRRL